MAGFAGVFGLLIGSFLNVVIYRVPQKKSIVSPPSACGNCGHVIRWYDNIPLVSWLILRGRCRDCGSRISIRYPLVELAGAAFFAIIAVRFVPQILASSSSSAVAGSTLELVALLFLAAISLALAIIDLETRTLPNAIVLPGYVGGALLLAASALLLNDPTALLRAVIGLIALGVLYFALFFFIPGGMGFGDVKLAGLLGLYLGYFGIAQLVVGALSAFIFGGLFGVALLIARRATRKSRVPFGPWMLLGAWIGILAGPLLATWYLSLFGLGAL